MQTKLAINLSCPEQSMKNKIPTVWLKEAMGTKIATEATVGPFKWTLIKWVAHEANVKEGVPQKSSSQDILFTNWLIYRLIGVIV